MSGSVTLEDIKKAIGYFDQFERYLRPGVVLFVAHPVDHQAIMDRTAKYKAPEGALELDTMLGTPVWKTPKIAQGEIKSYYTWGSAYDDLKDVLNESDVAVLKDRAAHEAALSKATIIALNTERRKPLHQIAAWLNNLLGRNHE